MRFFSRFGLRNFFSGQFFGEISLLTGVPRSATITAATQAVIYEITQSTMAELLKNRSELMENLSQVMADRRLRNETALQSLTGQAQQEADGPEEEGERQDRNEEQTGQAGRHDLAGEKGADRQVEGIALEGKRLEFIPQDTFPL